MNILEKIKLLFKLKKIGNDLIAKAKEEVKMEGGTTKPGWKTSEFWMTVCTNVITVIGALNGIVDVRTAGIIIAAANGVYSVLRSLVKQPNITTVVENK